VTITRGVPWGELGPLPPGGVVVCDDAGAAGVVEEAWRRGGDVPPLGLLGGDLCRTVGGRGIAERLHTAAAARLSIDLLVVSLDGGPPRPAVAHVVVRGRTWWHGPVVAAMNAAWIGEWNAAPRSHPNDGLIDVLRADLPLGDRLKARRRLRTGTHLPHPGIRTSRSATATIELDTPAGVWIDGVRTGRARRVDIRLVADALQVVV
jgi:hypothetical protein